MDIVLIGAGSDSLAVELREYRESKGIKEAKTESMLCERFMRNLPCSRSELFDSCGEKPLSANSTASVASEHVALFTL
jgi:hypothetical protein